MPSRRRWGIYCASALAICLILILYFGAYVAPLFLLRSSPAVVALMNRVGEDSRVTTALGAPIRARWSVRGYVSRDETGWSESRVWIPVFGSRAEGTIYARAGQGTGAWVLTTLEFRPTVGPTIDLMGTPPGVTLGAPRGAVYLVPLGPPGRISLDDLPEYYRTLLGLDVFVLPRMDAPREAFNAERGQFGAERLLAAIRPHLPDVAQDPTATVIAVVEADLYAEEINWAFLFNFRGDHNMAVVASQRLASPAWRFWEGPNRQKARVRKLITKNIGVLTYGMPLTNDPTSLLYDGILATADLDLVQERFDGLGSLAEIPSDFGTHRVAPIEPEIVQRTSPEKPDGWYPCFLVRPGIAREDAQPIMADTTECLPGLRTDRKYDEVEVDLRAGLLMTRQTDLEVRDTMPLVFTRCYRLWDEASRGFGVGWNHPYDILPTGSRNPYTFVNLIMPDGDAIHYDRVSRGSGYADAVYEHTETLTPFLHSRFSWNGDGWDLQFPDGSLMKFPENYSGPKPHHGAPLEMRDSGGHVIRFTRDRDRNLEQLTSPSGHSIRVSHDNHSRVISATTDAGEMVRYEYDASGRLIAVKNGNRVLKYRYDGLDLISVEASGKHMLDVSYKDRRVASLGLSDGRTYRFEYLKLNAGTDRVSAAIVYAPDGSSTRVTIHSRQ